MLAQRPPVTRGRACQPQPLLSHCPYTYSLTHTAKAPTTLPVLAVVLAKNLPSSVKVIYPAPTASTPAVTYSPVLLLGFGEGTILLAAKVAELGRGHDRVRGVMGRDSRRTWLTCRAANGRRQGRRANIDRELWGALWLNGGYRMARLEGADTLADVAVSPLKKHHDDVSAANSALPVDHATGKAEDQTPIYVSLGRSQTSIKQHCFTSTSI